MREQILYNKYSWLLSIFLLLALILPLSCETIFNEATITGKVVNGETSQSVEGAFVRALGFSESVETDSTGSYELLLSIEDPELDAVTIEISKSGFLADTLKDIGLDLGKTVQAPVSNLLPIATTSGQVIISGFARNGVTNELVDSAFVTVFDHANATALSDSSGNYVLKFNVDADDSNSITIQISKSTFLPDTISNIGISFTDTIIVRDANLIPISTASGAATVFGKIINSSSSSSIENASVRAQNHPEIVQTNSAGEYYLRLTLEAGESNVVTLEAFKDGFNTASIANLGLVIGDTVAAPPFALLPISVTQGIASLSGKVVNGLTKAPLEGANIRALDHAEVALSDSTGNYVLSIAFAEGEGIVVNLEIGNTGFLTSTISNVGLSIGDTTVMATANLIPIDPGGATAIITGRIFDDVSNRALEGAVVKVLGHSETAVSDAGGNFELSIVIEFDQSNTVDIEFSHESFVADTVRDEVLNVGGTTNLSLMRLVPFSTQTTLSGRVIDDVSGASIENAIVRSLERGETTTTDFRGEYELTMTLRHDESNIISFDYFKVGFVPDSLLNVPLTRGGKVIAQEISLVPSQTTALITGRVKDGLNNVSISGALVRAIGGHSESTTTDTRGEYSLPVILSNEEDNIISIEISEENFVPDTLDNLPLARGGTFDAGLTTLNVIFADAIVTGTVIDDLNSEPVTGAAVRVFGFPETTTTDFRGEFTLVISISNAASSSIIREKSLNKFGSTPLRGETSERNNSIKLGERRKGERNNLSFDIGRINSVSEVVTLEISKENFIPDTLSNITISKGTTVSAGQSVLTTIAAAALVTGTVIDDLNSAPIENATIRVFGHPETAATDSRGEYTLSVTLSNNESNIVTLEVDKDNFIPDTLSNLALTRGGTVTAGLSTLTTIAALTTINGEIKDAVSGQPVSGANVTALGHIESAISNSIGEYQLSLLVNVGENDTTDLKITKSGFLSDTLIGIVIQRGGSVSAPLSSLTPLTTQTTITGNVNDAILGEALESASIRVLGHNETATTDFQGDYALTISLAHDEATTVQVVASLTDFIPDTLTGVSLVRGGSIAAAQASLSPEVRAGLPANATIFSVTSSSISIQGSGGTNESTDITYLLRDSAGVSLDKYRPTTVNFTLSGPGGGESLIPTSGVTDESGLVTTTLNSGTIAGAVQVVATFDPGTGPISSLPVPIAIHGGLPDSAHFTLTSTLNIAGLVSIREATVSAILGDKFSNIVRPGTAVQFQSKFGIIEGSDVTDVDGRASVTLLSSNPLPLTSDSGFVLITGETKDENGNSIFATTLMLWSGHTKVEMVGFAGSFAIADGGAESFTVRVADSEFGNPLEGGSTIDISASVGSVSGSAIVPDTQAKGVTTTLFGFTVRDDQPAESPPAPPTPSTVTILVTSPNGNVQIQISGTID